MTQASSEGGLRRARTCGYAVGAFNAVNLETAQAIVRAAESERAPVILQVSENAARHGGLEPLLAIGRSLAASVTVPVTLHFDHAESLESAARAVELGFDSVMLESGSLGPEEYAGQLRRLAEVAHARGASVEGEFEIVSKSGRAGKDLPLEALPDLVEASGCDTVCVAIGSEHKMTGKTATLDLPRLERIAALVAQPLVLHGSSGVREDDLRRAVHLGIAKVNLATELMVVFTAAVRAALRAGDVSDPRKYLGAGREAMVGRVREYIRLLGSAGRAG